jgi:hypothetical protein
MNNVQYKSVRKSASQKKVLKIGECGYMAFMVKLLLITLKVKHNNTGPGSLLLTLFGEADHKEGTKCLPPVV